MLIVVFVFLFQFRLVSLERTTKKQKFWISILSGICSGNDMPKREKRLRMTIPNKVRTFMYMNCECQFKFVFFLSSFVVAKNVSNIHLMQNIWQKIRMCLPMAKMPKSSLVFIHTRYIVCFIRCRRRWRKRWQRVRRAAWSSSTQDILFVLFTVVETMTQTMAKRTKSSLVLIHTRYIVCFIYCRIYSPNLHNCLLFSKAQV